jgi:hypothetical protein
MTMSCVKRARQGTTAGADEYVTGSRATEVSDRLRAACGARHNFSRQAVADILRERAAGGGRHEIPNAGATYHVCGLLDRMVREEKVEVQLVRRSCRRGVGKTTARRRATPKGATGTRKDPLHRSLPATAQLARTSARRSCSARVPPRRPAATHARDEKRALHRAPPFFSAFRKMRCCVSRCVQNVGAGQAPVAATGASAPRRTFAPA